MAASFALEFIRKGKDRKRKEINKYNIKATKTDNINYLTHVISLCVITTDDSKRAAVV